MTSYEDNTFDESESWKRDNDSWKNGYDDPLKGLESSMPMSIKAENNRILLTAEGYQNFNDIFDNIRCNKIDLKLSKICMLYLYKIFPRGATIEELAYIINTSIPLSDEALDILKNKIQQIKFN